MIKVISFDIGNTLVQQARVKSVRKIIVEQCDVSYEAANSAYIDHFITRKNSFEEFCLQARIQDGKKIERMIDEYYRINSNKILFDDVYDVLLELYNLKFKMITISNKSYKNPFRLKDFGIDHFLLKEFYSCEVGTKKPDIAIFQYAQQCMNVESEEILHIGDSFCSDYIAAQEASWNSILLTRDEEKRKRYCRDKSVQTINNLNEFVSFIKQSNE